MAMIFEVIFYEIIWTMCKEVDNMIFEVKFQHYDILLDDTDARL